MEIVIKSIWICNFYCRTKVLKSKAQLRKWRHRTLTSMKGNELVLSLDNIMHQKFFCTTAKQNCYVKYELGWIVRLMYMKRRWIGFGLKTIHQSNEIFSSHDRLLYSLYLFYHLAHFLALLVDLRYRKKISIVIWQHSLLYSSEQILS